MLEIHATHKDYGYRRMKAELHNQGYLVKQKESSKTDAETKSSGNVIY